MRYSRQVVETGWICLCFGSIRGTLQCTAAILKAHQFEEVLGRLSSLPGERYDPQMNGGWETGWYLQLCLIVMSN